MSLPPMLPKREMPPLTEEEQAKRRIAGQPVVAAVIGAVVACPPLFLGLYQPRATGIGLDGGQLLLALPGLPGTMICDAMFGASSRGTVEICAYFVDWAFYGFIVYVVIKVWEAL